MSIRSSPIRPIVTSLVINFAVTSCVGENPTREDLDDDLAYLPVIHAWDTYQQIGVVDGAQEYQLFRVTGATRLSGGRLVVANSGTSQLRYFGSDGEFLFSVGGYGLGPGEFRDLKGVYEVAADTILAFDEIGRTSYFDADGQFVRSTNVMLSQNRFPMDIWLYRTNWVGGVPDVVEKRLSAAEALDRLSRPTRWPWYHYVRIDAARNMWVGIDRNVDGDREFWTVYSPIGIPFARVVLPDRFRIAEIGETEVIGVWRDENDVEYIRSYPMVLPPLNGLESVIPAVLQAPGESDSANMDEARRSAVSLLRDLVTAEEQYFASNHTYTQDLRELAIEIPERSGIDLLEVGGRGWLAIFIDRDQPGICGIGLGAATPPGWREGSPTCAQLTVGEIQRTAAQ